MKSFLIATLLATTAFSAHADLVCFKRTYSPEHLANNPAQKVHSLTFGISDTDGDYHGSLYAITRTPRQGSSRFVAGGPCEGTVTANRGIKWNCGIDADGGDYTVEVKGNTAVLTVKGGIRLDVSGSDEGSSDGLVLAAGRTNGIYRLNKVANVNCAF